MYNGSQVQDDRWSNVSDVADSGRRIKYRCRCGVGCQSFKTLTNHVEKCKWLKSSLEEDIDYVECKICCHFRRKNITQHVKKEHGISREEYESVYGSTLASSSKTKYQERNSYNCDWISRANDAGIDLTDYKKKMGKAVSDSIMSNGEERKRRSKSLASLNKTDEFRGRSSETAKKTSRRKDIIEKRTKQLAEWRTKNPDIFYEKCVKKLTGSFQSKPEKDLFEIVSCLYPDKFKRNHQMRRINKFKSVKSGTRQIDILSKELKVIIEFDGHLHFNPAFGDEKLKSIKQKDDELNAVMASEGYAVIRVSDDQYSYHSGQGFAKSCIEAIKDIIDNEQRGIFLLGDSYKE